MEQLTCPVCNTPIAGVWMCTHSKCPSKLQQHMKDIRSQWRDKAEQFGRPEVVDKETE